MIGISRTSLILLVVAIFSYQFYLIYKEIKEAEDDKRRTLVKQYLAIFAGGGLLFAVSKVFFQPQLTQAYEWLSGISP